MAKYLDKTGLEYFWGKVKGWVNSSQHPIGSIYISTSSTFNPQTVWGGTWRKTADGRCLIGANDTYPLGSTGGEAAHYLTGNEMPPHGHTAGKASGFKLANEGIASSAIDHNSSKQFLYIDLSNHSASSVLSTNAEGGGASHNNMQPYLAVYIWERIA